MIDFQGAAGLKRQTEEESILHNHALTLLKLIVYQPADEVEVFVPTGECSAQRFFRDLFALRTFWTHFGQLWHRGG